MRTLSRGIVIALTFMTGTICALDRSEIDKKIEELKNKDPKVRAAALADLGPVFIDLNFAIMDVNRDESPEVAAVRSDLKTKLSERYKTKDLKPTQDLIPINEKRAIDACKLFAESEEIYHRTDYAKAGVLTYAQHMKGDNSLVETKAGKNDLELVDETFGNAEGNPGKATPKSGYCFKIFTSQGKDAPGGAKDYIVDGKMTLGYALLAYPSAYSKTGRNCFMIDSTGKIWKKDCGVDTDKIVETLSVFNPDKTWEEVK